MQLYFANGGKNSALRSMSNEAPWQSFKMRLKVPVFQLVRL